MTANGFTHAIKDDQSLKLFLSKMAKFDKVFCDQMASGDDFTLRLEVHGNKGEVIHCRVYIDEIGRPNGAQKRIDKKS